MSNAVRSFAASNGLQKGKEKETEAEGEDEMVVDVTSDRTVENDCC